MSTIDISVDLEYMKSLIMRYFLMDEKYDVLEHTIRPLLEKINNMLYWCDLNA